MLAPFLRSGQTKAGIRGTFDRHGYGFQYAVAKECTRLRDVGESTWSIDATEFPVEVHGDAKMELFDYIEVFYNQRRRHSTLGQISPAAKLDKGYRGWILVENRGGWAQRF